MAVSFLIVLLVMAPLVLILIGTTVGLIVYPKTRRWGVALLLVPLVLVFLLKTSSTTMASLSTPPRFLRRRFCIARCP